MARTRVRSVIVAGLLLGASVAFAETGAPSAASIIPVTGPSTGPGVSEPLKPELIPAMVSPDTKTGTITPKKATGRVTAGAHPTGRAVTVAHKPGAKSTVKKASTATTKHAGKTTGSAKAKQVATAKHKAPVHHAMVGKPVPVSKHQPAAVPAAKGGTSAQPVLPRV